MLATLSLSSQVASLSLLMLLAREHARADVRPAKLALGRAGVGLVGCNVSY